MVQSVAGTLEAGRISRARPFRAPHHSASMAALTGGGLKAKPGEISLAHNGVLFLDELPEFHRNVLEVMRQPLEDGGVIVARAAASVTFPCRFMLVAAMNPCPCGHYGDAKRQCRCTPIQMQRYRNKISGPLLDRIDIHVEVPAMEYQQLASLEKGEGSAAIRDRVVASRAAQRERFAKGKSAHAVHCNAGMRSKDVHKHCVLDDAAQGLLKAAMADLHLSARAYDRILKVARTIADLAGSDEISAPHVAEAIQYRRFARG